MTTFNEILGTQSGDSEATVKQRYKLLSIRVHPDKGGSKALMHLVRHSYENVIKGKGDHSLAIPKASSGPHKGGLERELAAVKKDRDELSALNQLLKAQLAQSKKENSSPNRIDYSRKVAQLEGEMVLLKEERNRFKAQKECAVAEQGKLAGELRNALSEAELLEAKLERQSGIKMPGMIDWAQKFWLPAMAMSSLVIVLALGSSMVDWAALTGWFKEPETVTVPPSVRVIHARPAIENVIKKVPSEQDSLPIVTENKRLPFLQLTNQTGIWSLDSYTESDKPYIAIRSANGSYVVNDCSGEFKLYLNEPLKPLRVAANLIYLHQNQHFHVYKIPYGQGASAQSWHQSRKLEINDEFFTSEAFRDSYNALLEKCRNVTS
ncbi:J domain-containing protein [Grimontia hollisae]|uniref:J domain-containing protein n=1 Tax=Grimontia hollisae TaxID=673 RepID=A0A377HNA1_GRIHO|nr:J domain-containing protein [Grimontia hollisae]STO57637.1 Uncharacterised protein [Grimontia hollisae]